MFGTQAIFDFGSANGDIRIGNIGTAESTAISNGTYFELLDSLGHLQINNTALTA